MVGQLIWSNACNAYENGFICFIWFALLPDFLGLFYCLVAPCVEFLREAFFYLVIL